MSFLRLLPQISVPSIEPRGLDESFLAEQFVDRLKARLIEMQRARAEHEQLDVVTFLPSGQAISVEVVGYANPALVTLGGREQGGREGLYVAGSSIIDTGLGLGRIDSLRLTKEGGNL
ncbi:MAG: hypothetical protein EWM73_02604 [Nitrospira sp.]|nr:MAG: hypothetical protein EWM73_02604 [Nitrospira sp.]